MYIYKETTKSNGKQQQRIFLFVDGVEHLWPKRISPPILSTFKRIFNKR